MCWLTGPIDSLKTCLYYFEPVCVETLCSLGPHHFTWLKSNQNDLYTQTFTKSEILELNAVLRAIQYFSTAHIVP